MTTTSKLRRLLASATAISGLGMLASSCASPAEPIQLAGVVCETPPPLHCPEANCPPETIAEPGNVTDEATGRQFFLDYPCGLKPGDDVIVVLNLHGGGSIGNWQRHYFPMMDYKDEYNLVIATPSGTSNGWRPDPDDAHLHNVVELVENELAANDVDIRAFWLAGHSLGGQTSNRLINDDPFFRERLTGWVSLSGGRLGSTRESVRAGIPRAAPPPGAERAGPPPGPPPSADGAPPVRRGLVAYAEDLPDIPFSFIYETGEHELTEAGLPEDSKWAAQLNCGPQTRSEDVVDETAGYVYDSREQANRNPVWGLDPRPGTAAIYTYPNCPEGLVVADVVRMDKGHTEGLEPNVTETIIRMMVEASPEA